MYIKFEIEVHVHLMMRNQYSVILNCVILHVSYTNIPHWCGKMSVHTIKITTLSGNKILSMI